MRKCFWLRLYHLRGHINALKRFGVKGRVLGMGGSEFEACATARHVPMKSSLNTKILNTYGFIMP